MQSDTDIRGFLDDLSQYIGHDFLKQSGISVDLSTRFSDLRFDLVDEVIAERMVREHFQIPDWVCADWPDTIGDLISMVKDE